MLDWTTSFLSDETIINPKTWRCQTVSIGTLYVVASQVWPTIRGYHDREKAPHFTAGPQRKPT